MNAISDNLYYPSVSGALPGGVGVITYALQLPDGTVVTPASSAGIVENAPGSYTATRTAPHVLSLTSYKIVWVDTRNLTDPSDVDSLDVAAGPNGSIGLFYTSYDALRIYLGVTIDQMPDSVLAQPVTRAQRDIDAACGRWVPYADTGLKFVSATVFTYPITPLEARMLSAATCAQVEFRMTVGDDFMIRNQYEQQGGQNSTHGRISKLAGPAYTKLGQGGLLNLTGKLERHRFHRGFLADAADNTSLAARYAEDVHFGDLPRNLGLIPTNVA